MKSKNINFKWFGSLGSLFIVAIFFSFAVTLPSVSAQGEATPTATETSTDLPTESTFFPTITPTAFIEQTPLELQELEQPLAPFQSMQQSSSSLESIWPTFNISDTDLISMDWSIAIVSNGKVY